MSIVIVKVKTDDELYCHYDRQIEPQSCFIAIDCEDEEMWADYNAEIGNAVPSRVWHGHIHWFYLPTTLKADAVNRLMEKILPDCEKIVAGYKSVWDGNNYVAKFTPEAQEIIDRLDADIHNDDYGDDVYTPEEQEIED